MSNNVVHKWPAPALPWDTCIHPAIGVDWVPYALGALRLRAFKYWWASPEDAQLGRWAMNEMAARMLLACDDEILKVLESTYRLQSRALLGTVYTTTGAGTDADPLVTLPEIPPAPIGPITQGMAFDSVDQKQMLDNSLNGTLYPSYGNSRAVKVLLEEIILKLDEQDFDTAEMEGLLQTVVILLGGL